MPISTRISYSKILAIKPAHHHSNGTAVAIFDEETQTIHACDLLFATNQHELAHRARKFWDTQAGDQKEPKALCIEYPRQFLGRASFFMSYLCANLEHKFSPQIPLRPRSESWQRLSHTPAAMSDHAKYQLTSIAKTQESDICDVISLALWANEKIFRQRTLNTDAEIYV